MPKRISAAADPWPEQILPKPVTLASVPPAGTWHYEINSTAIGLPRGSACE